jgi:hypothetical protein
MRTEHIREIWRKASKKYYQKNKDKCIARSRRNDDKQENNKYNSEKFKKMYTEDNEYRKKQLLRSKHRYHIKKEFCEKCGKKDQLEIHHPEYSEEIKVKILCRKCHRGLGGEHQN